MTWSVATRDMRDAAIDHPEDRTNDTTDRGHLDAIGSRAEGSA